MKKLILSALAVLSLSVAAVPSFAASSVAGDRSATVFQQTGTYGGD